MKLTIFSTLFSYKVKCLSYKNTTPSVLLPKILGKTPGKVAPGAPSPSNGKGLRKSGIVSQIAVPSKLVVLSNAFSSILIQSLKRGYSSEDSMEGKSFDLKLGRLMISRAK